MRLHREPDAPDSACAHSSTSSAALTRPWGNAVLATLLARHALRDGEIIHLAIKPSLWFVLLSSLRFIAATLICTIAVAMIDSRFDEHHSYYWEAAAFVAFGRLTWAALNWMSKLYVLTDQRIIRIEGVFSLNVFDCPLRKVARVDIVRSTRERIFRLGSMHISPLDQSQPPAQWQMVARPNEVQARIVDAIERHRNSTGNMFAAA